MSAQKRKAKKNFIAILNEIPEEQRVADRPAKPDRPAGRGFLRRLATALGRGAKA